MKRGRWKCLCYLSYHLSFHVQEIRQKKLTQLLSFRDSLTDGDYVLQESSNQTNPGAAFTLLQLSVHEFVRAK